jgi:ubiquinone/menaquinone biosynthesis C-methylase UbiE
MRITYRWTENKAYWDKRWSVIAVDEPMENDNVYPLKYAKLTVTDKKGKILEAGCGAGRVLRYYHREGYDIIGIDFVEGVIDKLKIRDPTLKVEVGDITCLRFVDASFRYLLAFGLYHNLSLGFIQNALKETYRVLEAGGRICASFRADNIQTRLTDWLAAKKTKAGSNRERHFHKMNLSESEFVKLFCDAGFTVERVYPVENMPLLYKFSFFRSAEHRIFNESLGRKEGYELSRLGKIIQGLFVYFFPKQFCNIFVLIARKGGKHE